MLREWPGTLRSAAASSKVVYDARLVTHVVTTSSECGERQQADAHSLADRYGLRFASRRHRSVARLHQEEAAEVVGTLTEAGLVLHRAGQRLPFATGMAELRIQRVLNGEHEPLVTLGRLGPGTTVLDCTMGLGRDALVMASSGATVDGVESMPLLAAFLDAGLARLSGAGIDSATRVLVRHADAQAVLTTAESKSYDVVYFDPMFGEEVRQAPDYEMFRLLADGRPLKMSLLHEARRVARRAVVIKDGPRARLLKSIALPLRELTFGTRVRYVVVEPLAP